MSNIVVNSATSFLNSSTVVRVNGTTETGTESFDETLKSLKKDNCTTQPEKAQVNRSDEDKTDNAEAKKLASSGKRDAVKQEEEVTDEQIAAVSEEVVSQIKEVIREQFGISEEELSAVMDSLGMSDENLSDTGFLTKLVMKLDGVENQSDILVNSDFAEDLKGLMLSVDQIKTKALTEGTDMEKLTEVQNESEVEIFRSDADQSSEMLTVENEADTVSKETDIAEMTEQATIDNSGVTGAGVAKNGEGQSEGLLKNDDSKGETVTEDGITNNQAIQLQDFAAKLTEDLAGKVGEEKATDIVRQVVEQVQVQTKQGMTSMEMQLYPEHLGKVVVQMVTRDGHITAQIIAETEATKNALESQLTLLKENLNNQGVKIENVQVTIASHAFEQNMQGERGHEQKSGNGNKGRRAGRILEEGFVNDSREEPGIMEARGNTVSYSA